MTAMVVTVAQQKGGAGKTTLRRPAATALARRRPPGGRCRHRPAGEPHRLGPGREHQGPGLPGCASR